MTNIQLPEPVQVTGTVRLSPKGFGFLQQSPQFPNGLFIPPTLASDLFKDDTLKGKASYDSYKDSWSLTHINSVSRVRKTIFGERRGRFFVPDPEVSSQWLRWQSPPVADGTLVEVQLYAGEVAKVLRQWPQGSFEGLLQMVRARHNVDVPVAPVKLPDFSSIGTSPVRRDLTGLIAVTIDDPSSQDLDDALSAVLDSASGVITAYVHISDVVPALLENPTVLASAATQATTIYLPDGVRHMSPAELSEKRLSLLPGKVSNAITTCFDIHPNGAVVFKEVFASTISTTRLSYAEVQAWLDGEPAFDQEFANTIMWAYDRLRKSAPDQSIHQSDVTVVNDNGKIGYVADNAALADAQDLVAQFMITTNSLLPVWARSLGAQLPVRAQLAPAVSDQMIWWLEDLNLTAPDEWTPASIAATQAALPTKCSEEFKARLGQDTAPAFYTLERLGHYSLEKDAYSHSTSPIRRFADVHVQLLVHQLLAGTRPHKLVTLSEDFVRGYSDRAFTAAQAEKDAKKLAIANTWADRIETSRLEMDVTVGEATARAVRCFPEEPIVVEVINIENPAPGTKRRVVITAVNRLSGEVTALAV